jgi:hypothetical protein
MVQGRLSKNLINITLTTNFLKNTLGLKLSDDEKQIERRFLNGK